MTAQARRAAPAPSQPRTRSATGVARPPLTLAPNPGMTRSANPPTTQPADPVAETNPKRKRRGRKGHRKGRRNPKRRRNPVASTLGILGIGVAAATIGYFGYREISRRRALNKPLAQSLSSILKPGATLAEVPFIVDDVQQPIMLSISSPPPSSYSLVPEIVVHAPGTLSNGTPMSLKNVDFGSGPGGVPNDLMWEGRDLSGAEATGVAAEGVSKAIGSLVTNVAPDFARQSYERVLAKVASGEDWDTTHDDIIASVLKVLAPGVDWTQGLAPYVKGDAASQVWSAVQTIGAVADQTYWNKKALAGG